MPLMKSSSHNAFESNLKAELGAGKPKKQALAIAYDVQRRSGGKKMPVSSSKSKSFAKGGYVKGGPVESMEDYAAKRSEMKKPKLHRMSISPAKGGVIVRHEMEPFNGSDQEHIVTDLKGLHSHLAKHFGKHFGGK